MDEADRQAEAIANEWGVNPDLLADMHFELESNETNDGMTVSYFVRFDNDTDRDLLDQLGVEPGQFYREVSVNAFDEDEQEQEEDDDGTFSLDEPFPDLPPGDVYLTDDEGAFLTDEKGRRLIATGQPLSGAVGGAPVNQYDVNGQTYVGRSFAGHSYASDDKMPVFDRNAVYQRELESRIERLEATLKTYSDNLPPRNHNHPPELVEPDPIAPSDLNLVVKAVVELKVELGEERPDPVKLEEKASLFRRVAGAIAAWCLRKVDAAVDSAIQWGVPIGLGWVATNPQDVHAALNSVAEAASAWAKYLAALM